MGPTDGDIDGWDLGQLSMYLGDQELRYHERLVTGEFAGLWTAQLTTTTLDGHGTDLESAMRELARKARDRDETYRPNAP